MTKNILLGTYTKKNSVGIYYTILKNGHLSTPKIAAKATNPTYIRTTKNFAYAVTKNGENGGIAAYHCTNNKLTFINDVVAAEAAPCYIGISHSKPLVFSANYHAANVKSFIKANDGTLTLADTFTAIGSGPRQEQKSAHLHYVDELFDGTLVVCDLGSDKVYTLSVTESGKLAKLSEMTTPAGFGPRHITLAGNHKDAYLVGELSSKLAHLTYDTVTHSFSFQDCYSTIPDDFTAHNGAAAVRLSADEKFVYVSNRGHNSIAVFALNEDGSTKLIQLVPTRGDFPRDFDLVEDQGQTYLVCAHQNDGVLSLFIQNEDGTLKFCEQTTCPEGVCVCVQ